MKIQIDNPQIKSKSCEPMLSINWSYYSSLSKLVRHLSWLIKLKNNWIKWKSREKHRENFNYLSYDEIQNSHHILLSLSQKRIISR